MLKKGVEDGSAACRTIVQIIDNTIVRNDWPRRRVVEVLPGRDGRVSMVKVQLARGNVLTRPVSKLVILTRRNED